MKCSISAEAQRKLRAKIAKHLLDLQKANGVFDMKAYSKSIYDFILSATGDRVQALDFARLVPFMVNQLQSQDLRFAKLLRFSKVDFNELMDLVISLSEDDGLSKTEVYLDLLKNDVKETLNHLNSEGIDSPKPTVEVSGSGIVETDGAVKPLEKKVETPVQRSNPVEFLSEDKRLQFYRGFTAVAPTLLADAVFEAPYLDYQNRVRGGTLDSVRVPLKNTVFYYGVKREILKALFNQGVGLDSTKIVLGDIEGIYLMPKKASDVESSPYSNQLLRHDKNSVVLVVTDRYGVPILFDENTLKPVLQNGKQAYYAIRNAEEFFDASGKPVLSKLKSAASALSTVNKISQEQALSQIIKEANYVNRLRKAVNENPDNNFKFRINGGSLGYIETSFSRTTPLKDIKEPLQFEVADATMAARDPEKITEGFTYVTTPGLHGQYLAIERPGVNETPYVNEVLDLLTIPLLTDTKEKLLYEERRALLRSILDVNDKRNILIGQKDNGDLRVSLKGTLLDLSPEGVEASRQKILQHIQAIKPGVLMNDKPVYQLKTHVNANLIGQNVKIPSISIVDGVKVVQISEKPYSQFLADIGMSVNTRDISADGKLLRTNAYFTYEFVQEEKAVEDITDPVSENEIVSEEPSVEKVESIPDVNEDIAEKDVDSLLSDIWEDDELNSTLDVKNRNRAVTEAQIAEAKLWFEKHPLSKHVSFKTMFDVVNQKPGVVASWTRSGITLFKGADYTDLYHEAWHSFTQSFLTKQEKKSLYRQVRKLENSFVDHRGKRVSFSKASDLQIEEYLAESFRQYVLNKATPQQSFLKRLFEKILSILKNLFGRTNQRESIFQPGLNKEILDLFEKFRVGDISEFSFAEENVNFGLLDQGIYAFNEVTEGPTQLNYADSKTLTDMTDVFIAEFVDMLNAKLTVEEIKIVQEIKEKLRRKDLPQHSLYSSTQELLEEGRYELTEKLKAYESRQTYKYTGMITKSSKVLLAAYVHAYQRFNGLLQETKRAFEEETNETRKARLEKDFKILEFGVNHFGDIKKIVNNKPKPGDPIKGVLAYHMMKTKVFMESEILLDFEDMSETDTYVKSLRAFDRAGNESSLKELAKAEIIYLLQTLPNRDAETNRFGIPPLANFQASWNRLARSLAGAQDFSLMYEILKKEAEKYRPFEELLKRMGDPLFSKEKEEVALWTNFWQTFNKTRIPLIQVSISETEHDVYEARVGEAFNADFAVGKKWSSDFNAGRAGSSKYILRDNEGSYLDLNSLLKDFDATVAVKDPMAFYNAIGFTLTNTADLKEELFKKSKLYTPQYFYLKLVNLQKEGVVVRDLSQITSGLESRYRELQKLEAKYSDQFSNFMVTNAEGNAQFEHSLNNTLTIIVNSINQAPSFQDLIAQPHMSYLNPEKNPLAKASWWLRSVFNLEGSPANNPDYGKRRQHRGEFVSLKLTNLSGVLLKGVYDESGEGISSASADEYTKLIMDAHLSYGGFPELMRHADKGTSFSITVDGPILNNKTSGEHYIPLEAFKSSYYETLLIQRLLPHLIAEVEKIELLKTLDDESLENYDFRYLKKGQSFGAFDNVLTPETKNRILNSEDPVNNVSKNLELRNAISSDIKAYFNEQYLSVSEKFKEASFIATNIMTELDRLQVSNSKKEEIFLKSYVYNNWIHNIESLAVIYGDILQYNEVKEEFHKRNAGAGSTGTLFRADPLMLNYVNTELWNSSYASKNASRLGIEEPHRYDGTLKTAIIEDQDIVSVYYEEYKKVLGNKANAYGQGQNEADAQGFITFDAYRILKNSEGSWSNQQELVFQKIIKGEKVPSNLTKIFPVMKAQYWGPLHQEAGPPLMAFHKYSLFPMIPTAIKGTNMEIVHDKMVKEQIAYLTFNSGSKVSRITKKGVSDKLYDTGRSLVGELSDFSTNEKYFTPNVIYLQYLKNQLEMHDEFKGKVIFSTQLRKLIEDGLMENGVPTDFMNGEEASKRQNAWEYLSHSDKLKSTNYKLILDYERNIERLTQYAKEKILEEINWTSEVVNGEEHLKGKMENLLRLVRRELSREDLGEHSLDFIQIDDQGQLKYDLSLSYSVEKIEKLLSALMVKRLVKQKVNGEALVQVASTLLEEVEINTSEEQSSNRKTLSVDLEKKGSNDLPFYRQKKSKFQEIQEVKNRFQVTTLTTADKKAVPKSKVATQYIGFAEGISGSSTAHYAEQAGALANTGNYSSSDVVFVSVPGKRGDETVRKKEQTRTVQMAIKAIEAGAVILADNKAYVNKNPYNEGEKLLKKTFEQRNYSYTEITVDDELIGVWSKTPLNAGDNKTLPMKVKVALAGDFVHLLGLLHNDGQVIRSRERLNEMIKDEAWLNVGRRREMLTMIGVRIPVQGLNSMEFMEVYHFLPFEAGPVIVPPTEIVTKSGGDFDVDKLTVMMPNIRKGKNVHFTEEGSVILPIGTSGSGKSTWIKSLKGDYTIISPDEMRKEFTGDMNNKSKDDEIYEEVKVRAIAALKSKKNVIVDTTNLQKERRRDFINAIKKEIPGANLMYKLMPLNPSLAKERIKNDLRKGIDRANVPDSTIDRHALLYEQALQDIKEEAIINYDSQTEPQMWNWTEDEILKEYEIYSKTFKEKLKEANDIGLDALWSSLFGYEKADAETEVEEMFQDMIDSGEVLSLNEFKKRKLGSKGIQNDIMQNIKSILELPQNFRALITPNSTDLVEPLASELKEYVMKYNPLDNMHNQPRRLAKETSLKKVTIKFSPENQRKIEKGLKTTTIRSERDADKIGLAPGESGEVVIGNRVFKVTARGAQTIAQAGGKEAMLASEGVSKVQDFQFEQTKEWIEGTGKLFVYDFELAGKEIISPTRSLEIQYNLYKHSSNNVGKQTLGLGAVDNTYNTLFNRIGAYMSPSNYSRKEYQKLLNKEASGKKLKAEERKKLNSFVPQKLLLKHNSLIINNEEAISLSHIYDADGKIPISDVVNQLLNGWVDIAKDAWVFNIQGNKEVSPVLLFMIQAGVPVADAIYFVSNPLIRKYVKAQKLAKSTFGGPLNTAYRNKEGKINLNFFKAKARKDILTDPSHDFKLGKINASELAKLFNNTLQKYEGSFFKKEDLRRRAKSDGTKITALDRDVFAHYLHLEEMSKSVRDVKLQTNVDTARDVSLFEAQDRLSMLHNLEQDQRIPSKIVQNIQKSSPISSFFIQRFQIMLLGGAFPLRNHEKINNFLRDHLTPDVSKETYNLKEVAAINWKSDLVNFLFQNELKYFDLNDVENYRGWDVDELQVEKNIFLRHGAFIKDNKFYIDKNELIRQFKENTYASAKYYTDFGLAPMPTGAFYNDQEYYHFVLDREVFRFTRPISSLKYSKRFQQKLKDLRDSLTTTPHVYLKRSAEESKEDYKRRLVQFAYEQYISELALHSTYNHYGLFKGDGSYANEFLRIKKAYPQLSESFALMDSLDVSSKKNYKNLTLRDGSLDGDQINVLYENLHGTGETPSLTNRVSLQEILPEAGQEDIDEIVEFFEQFPIVAFLQSGMNMKSSFSLISFVSQDKMLSFLEKPLENLMKLLNSDSDVLNNYLMTYHKEFVIQNRTNRRFDRIRGKNYNKNLSLVAKRGLDALENISTLDEFVEQPSFFDSETKRMLYIGSQLNRNISKKMLQENPDSTYIYNAAATKKSISINADASLMNAGPNALGLTTLNAFGRTGAFERTDLFRDVNGQINPKVKDMIDFDILQILEAEKQGQTLVFNSEGYGQSMLERDSNGNYFAPKTFLYLSRKLYENFGYVNKSYLMTKAGKAVLQENQDISDAGILKLKEVSQQFVEDFITLCKG